jgi:Ca2+-binding EF-hand superfamily protein
MSKQLTPSYIAELKTVFDSFDADGNGSLSRDEIADVLRSLGMNPSDEDIRVFPASCGWQRRSALTP